VRGAAYQAICGAPGEGVVEDPVTVGAGDTVVARNAVADRVKAALVWAVIVAHCEALGRCL
jgi:hypothetical protein